MITNCPILLQLSLSLKYRLCILRLTFPFVILKLAILTSVLIRECLKTTIMNTLYGLPVWYLATMPRSRPSWQKRSTSRSPERFDRSLILSLHVSASNAILPVICLPTFHLSHPILHHFPHAVTIPKSDMVKWMTYTPLISYGLPNSNYSIILSPFRMKALLGTIPSVVTFAKTSSLPSKFP